MFLVLHNIINSKKIYLILSIPVMCIVIGLSIVGYHSYVPAIPTVSEQNISGSDYYSYVPFFGDNLLARLDEESNLKLTNKLPALDGQQLYFQYTLHSPSRLPGK